MSSISKLETKQKELQQRARDLKGKKDRVEQILQLNKNQLQLVLTEALKMLKWKKPELFTLSGPEQFAMLLRFLRDIFS